MSKREQAAFTRAFVELARKGSLRESERRTLATFRHWWLDGHDLNIDHKTYTLFIEACFRHGVDILYMQKNRDGGPMDWVVWTTPQVNGSYWPRVKGQTREERNRSKASYRLQIMHEHMAELGISELDLRIDERERMESIATKVVDARMKPVDPIPPPDGIDFTGGEFIDFGTCPGELRTTSFELRDAA